MRERLFIIGSIAVLLVLLVGLNAASFVRVEREPELEIKPDRSTYNAGATGTRALYQYLIESGRQVMRWREPIAALTDQKHSRPATFVIVGRLRVPYTREETDKLRQWVEAGGRLVVIDRRPDATLPLPAADNYMLSADVAAVPNGDVRATDTENLTAGTKPIAPTQPTLLTRDVAQIAPSRFAGRLQLKPVAPAKDTVQPKTGASGNDAADTRADESAEADEPPPPKPMPAKQTKPAPTPQGPVLIAPDDNATKNEAEPKQKGTAPTEPPPSTAPVFHLADERGALVADYVRGHGRVIILSDPFVVANNGIERADNLQLALNLSAGGNGLIAFDEYHQGRAATENELAAYFAGTPVLALCGQALLLVCALVWTRGRRFARPLPAPRVDRRSKLEFVASMAELQQRARAYDLAVENVYARTRRALARYGGVAQNVPRAQLAARVAARSGLNKDELETLMRECEDAINGEPTNARRALALVHRLRELERTLGIRMRVREIKQAAQL